MRCGVEIEALSEKEAIHRLQYILIDEGDYMTELIDIVDISYQDEDPSEWSIEDGPVLDQEDQDILNEAFNTFVNEDGLTMKEVIDNKNK
jgi:uncharacterized protein YrzB (UPF0473 family)